jgi:hypothetical protein
MMSRKDYVAIALAIRAEYDATTPGYESPLVAVARRIANVLANDNPRFDHDRFIEAALGGDR